MFTGIVHHFGNVIAVEESDDKSIRIVLMHDLEDVRQGDSVALNGVCLTAKPESERVSSFDISPETAKCTTLAAIQVDQPVHLELPLTPTTRIGGHWVMGHVDECLTVSALVMSKDCLKMVFSGASHPEWLLEKGSVAVDGVSLTINGTDASGGFECLLIPHTLAVTHFSTLKVGDKVNIEYDYLAKVIAKQLASYRAVSVSQPVLHHD